MNWKKVVIDKLKEYAARKNALKTIPQEIARLEDAVCRIRAASLDATPTNGGGCTREDMLLSNIVHRQELEWRLSDTERWIKVVDAALFILGDEDRRVLELMCINRAKGNVERLCDELCVEKPTVYRRRDEALRMVTIALYGVEV